MDSGIKKYPLDLTGTAPTNLTLDERVVLPRTKSRAFSPRNGPFFANSSFVLRSLPSGKILVPEVDYTSLFLYESATFKTNQPICGIIHVTNPDYDGEFSYDYQVVGGNFSSNVEAIAQAIEALELDGRAVHWDDVLDKPVLFPAAPHMHHVNDLYGMDALIAALEAQTKAITEGDSLMKSQILERLARQETTITQLQSITNTQALELGLLTDRVRLLEAKL